MSGLKTAAQQMLEALEGGGDSWRLIGPAIDDLRAALEQPEQESVAMCRTWHKGSDQHAELLDWTDALEALPDGEHHLYTHPPRREWRPLSDEEMHRLYRRAGLEAYYPRDFMVQYDYEKRLDAYARAIEAALKERNV